MLLTYSDLLNDSIWLFVTFFGAVLVALVCGITFHEASHAFTADRLGDHTARLMGRVSLNPARHLDPTGTFFMLIAGFGWGKPTPVNPRLLRNGPQAGRAVVAAAGPLSNLLLAVLASIPMHLGLVDWHSPFLIPRSVASWSVADYVGLFLSALIIFNLILCVFNFLPVAPLDGFAVAVGILPRELSISMARLEPYGPGILMLLLVLPYVTGYSVLSDIMSPVLNLLARLIVGGAAVF